MSPRYIPVTLDGQGAKPMVYLRKTILLIFLAMPLSSTVARAGSQPSCENSIVKNCSCAMPILETRLSPDQIDLLIRAWTGIQSQDANRLNRFFAEQAANLLPVSLRYGEIKYSIGALCGALAFDDE